MDKQRLVPTPDWRDARAYGEYNGKIVDNFNARQDNPNAPLPWPDHPESGADIAALITPRNRG